MLASSSRPCLRAAVFTVVLIALAFLVLPHILLRTSSSRHAYNPSENFKSISSATLAQLVASLGREYSPYAKRVEDDRVSGTTIEFIYEQNYNAGLDNLLLDMGVQRWAHRTVLKQKMEEWREAVRPLDDAGVELFLSKLNVLHVQQPHAADAESPPTSQEAPENTAVPTAPGKLSSLCFSVTGPQAARLFEIAVKTAKVCPAADAAAGSSFGIPKEQAEWYESAHEEGVQQADKANDGVSDTAVGNGWEYGDDDILGMVAPLALELGDSMLDVGCGDGFFLERMLRVLPQLQLKVMGVDLMQFSINTARSRFLRLALEFFDSNSDLYRDSSTSAPCVGSSCAVKSFPIACAGSGLHMPWILPGSFSKYISVYPINHFDDQGSEKLGRDALMQICEAYRVLRPGGIAFFGMINRDEGTFLGPYFRNESWWPSVAHRCGFESVVTTSKFTEWRAGPARYHAYLQKSKDDVDEASKPNMSGDADAGQPAATLLASGSKQHSTNAKTSRKQ